MKYLQVVSMPSAVQHWLEEQLEARGIDSAIYSRYILSLLCHDQPDSFDLPCKSKEVNKKGCGRKRGRRDDVWDLEKLKRSAAIECLTSASEQSTGIEALVDELCLKLKANSESELQVKAQDAVLPELIPVSSLSTSNQESALRYYAAFPPLSKAREIDSSNLWNSNRVSAWSGKRVLGSSFGKNRTYSEGNNKEIKLSSDYSWVEENKENQSYKKDAFSREKMRSRSMVKQHISEKVRRNMAKSLDRKDDDSFRFMRMKADVGKNRRLYQLPSEAASDPNFSKLVSCSIKALWTPEKASDDLSGCDQDLPMDFQQLLESPESTKSNVPFCKRVGKQSSSFIQCGTNITSSIWSEKVKDVSMDTEGIADISTGLPVTLTGCSVWTNENVSKNSQPWNDSKNCFTNVPWKIENDFTSGIQEFGASEKWSDVEGTSLLLDDSSTFYSSLGASINNSLTTLNHNKEDSSFTEVIPKNISNSSTNAGVVFVPDTSKIPPAEVKKEEEDLLTSMKTHFRPIKQEAVDIPVRSIAAPNFPDGTTFPISNSFERPTFQRSASGALYLESDFGHKYMEYNNGNGDVPGDFVLKFRVRQNEKFCQTDDLSKVVGSMPFDNKVPMEHADAEFYFPEDESLVREIVEEDGNESEENSIMTEWGETRIKVGGWVAAWPANSGIWSNNEANNQQSWFNIWSGGEENLGGGDQYLRLRDELTEEAEELLSDLSSMQNLYLASDSMESNENPQVQPSKHHPDFLQNTNSILFCVESEQKINERLMNFRIKDRKRRHWSSQHVCSGDNCQASRIPCPIRPLTL